MSILTDFRQHLVSDPSLASLIGGRVHQGAVPQGSARPYIWFRRAGIENERCTDDAPGQQPFEVVFDLEIVSDDPDESDDIAELVRFRLDSHQGQFGEGQVQGVFVADHSDEYFRRNDASDQGDYVPAMEVRVFPLVS